jgi:1-acyl-sn-glycerol-3-phosphate acyltransferase
VSYLLRLDEQPLVDPGRGGVEHLENLHEMAATTTHPMLIFPEGSRTRDGEIRPFKTAGLEAILAARRWKVHVVVVDGFSGCARLVDYIQNISSVRARIESIGPFASPGPEEDVAAFIARMRDLMCDKLHEMRDTPASRATKQERHVGL